MIPINGDQPVTAHTLHSWQIVTFAIGGLALALWLWFGRDIKDAPTCEEEEEN